jgi:hypothetical protein
MADFCEVLTNVWVPSQQKLPRLSEWLPLFIGISTHKWRNPFKLLWILYVSLICVKENCILSTSCIYGFHIISNSVNFPMQHQFICLCNWQGVLFLRGVNWTFDILFTWMKWHWKSWVEHFISVFSRKNVGCCDAVLSWRRSFVCTAVCRNVAIHIASVKI